MANNGLMLVMKVKANALLPKLKVRLGVINVDHFTACCFTYQSHYFPLLPDMSVIAILCETQCTHLNVQQCA